MSKKQKNGSKPEHQKKEDPIEKNEHGSYIDNDYERSMVYVMKGGKPRNDFERKIKKEIDEMPDDAVMDIPSDI